MYNYIKKEIEEQEKMQKRADILYPSMKKQNKPKKKIKGLGESIFDDYSDYSIN